MFSLHGGEEQMFGAECALLRIGAAPGGRWSVRRGPDLHTGGATMTGVPICFLVVFGAVRDLLLSAKHLFLAAKARRQRAQTYRAGIRATVTIREVPVLEFRLGRLRSYRRILVTEGIRRQRFELAI
jgi:hypothetical protein